MLKLRNTEEIEIPERLKVKGKWHARDPRCYGAKDESWASLEVISEQV